MTTILESNNPAITYKSSSLFIFCDKTTQNIFDIFPTATAPTSFEGNYGKIVYRVRAFIDTPRFAKDYNTEKAFFLLSLLNLNEVPDIWVRYVCGEALGVVKYTLHEADIERIVVQLSSDMMDMMQFERSYELINSVLIV